MTFATGGRETAPVRVVLLLFTVSGCFWRAQAGYVNALPLNGAGGANLEVSAGSGDLRKKPSSVLPEHFSVDVAGSLTTSGHRLGLGPSVMWVPLSGWEHEWSPTVRLGSKLLQVEWLPLQPATGSISGLLELGLVFLDGRTTRGRLSFGFSLGAEVFARYGIAAAPGVRGFVSFSVGYGNSIGPTS